MEITYRAGEVEAVSTKHVTPYIHALMNHVGQFMRTHGSILPFTQQGLEKLNDITTKNFFRSSCLRVEALKQLIEKQNRIEHFNDTGKKRATCKVVQSHVFKLCGTWTQSTYVREPFSALWRAVLYSPYYGSRRSEAPSVSTRELTVYSAH